MKCIFFSIFLFFIQITFTRSYGAMNFRTKPTHSIDKSLAMKALQSQNKSMVVSGLCVKLSLCKLATVAEEEAQKELISALGLNSESQLEKCYLPVKQILITARQTSLIWINKLYFNFSMDLDPLFVANASALHGVEVDKVGFEYPKTARSFINNWVEQLTFSRIPDMLDVEDVIKGTSSLIVNAIHFKLCWQEQFSAKYTKIENFRTLTNAMVKVPMMHRDGQYLFYESEADKFKLVTMYLLEMGMSFTIVVPTRPGGLPILLAKLALDPEFLSKIREEAKLAFLSVKIPRLKIKTTTDWRHFLEQVGVKQIFNSTTSGLDAILRTRKTHEAIFLSKIKQKIFFELDEYGIYRGPNDAQYQDEEYGDTLPGMSKTDLIADRPFLFTVNLHGVRLTRADSKRGPEMPTSKITDELLMGVYYGPES